ncbi:hypothetical protein J40TS1_40370 [Paenibacillus montaniterrae]|uniref:IrrE N-terminal-like domain-containing protein n=1 Tax=Paenibacillus montaniterrae TaxID=429341 RepID=A0A920CZE9_9BACL|nr:ImmA/IrrE family metallo-endopeptidase [Paenibacillus montaniterrae]GIP18395.1 hypothetical protein J40TS1_40370 [Paenibacillus montaniterrae]
MQLYERLLAIAEEQSVYVYEKPMSRRNKGLYADQVIWINKNLNTKQEKACILSEELGHYFTSSGNILDQSSISNRKQEYRARAWGYEQLIPLHRFVEAWQQDIEGRHAIAEYLEVTEDFLQHTIDHYQRKFGLYATYENYLIYFEPLNIIKM